MSLAFDVASLRRFPTPDANQQRQTLRVAYRQTQVGPIQPHDPAWSAAYETVRRVVVAALPGLVVGIEHVGSTSVADLAAKPLIDVDLTVPDVDAEATWLPPLEAAGFRLIFRDRLGGDPHSQLTYADPNTNLHVWGPGAAEPQRHLIFRDWLRDHSDDRRRYEQVKLDAARPGQTQNYNDAKTPVVRSIYERAFDAMVAGSWAPPERGELPRS